MLLTATPMINKADEIVNLVNLLLPINNQMPNKFDFKSLDFEKYRPYFHGLISYIRRKDEGIRVIEEGVYDTKDESYKDTMKFFPILMSDFQEDIYIKNTKLEEVKRDNFNVILKEISNFVFPDGSFGTKGFNNYVIKQQNDIYSLKAEFKKILSVQKNLKEFSPKFNTIIKINKQIPGNCFCYIHQVHGSGAILLGLCLELYGFSRFLHRHSVFGEIEEETSCFQKRYALIVNETPNDRRDSILEVFNSPENVNGEYIKIIIGSEVTQVGISLLNSVIFINVSPEWTEAKNHQAQSRIIRANSHNDLLCLKKQEYEKK
jgi:hypothetical protein